MIQPQWSSSFSANASQFLCLECFPAFQRVDPLSFKSRLKFLSRFTSRQFILSIQHNLKVLYMFVPVLSACSLTLKTSPDQGRLFQPPAINFLNAAGILLSPYQTPTSGPRSRPDPKRVAGAVQPGSRSQSHPEASRLGTEIHCSVHGAVTSEYEGQNEKANTYPDLSYAGAQTQEGESRE